MEKEMLSNTAPHSGLEPLIPGSTRNLQEMPHQVRHEAKNLEPLEPLNLKPETAVRPMKPETLTAADLPPAVRAYWDSAPTPFKVPAILTAIDCYCALATRLRFKYTYDLGAEVCE